MSIADRWVRDRPQETVLANGLAALPDNKLLTLFTRTVAVAGGDVRERRR